MAYVLRLADVIVGRCELHSTPRGSLRGPFRPGLGWELIEPVFQLQRSADANGAQARYAAARDALALVLYAPGGALVESSRIDIVDDAASPSGLSIEVQVVQRGS